MSTQQVLAINCINNKPHIYIFTAIFKMYIDGMTISGIQIYF